MVVRREDNSFVDVECVLRTYHCVVICSRYIVHSSNFREVDCSFFLVTVDLWSADGKHEMNLVLHPTSADRYVPSSTPKVKRRGTGSSMTPASQRTTRQNSAPPPTPSSSQYPPVRIIFFFPSHPLTKRNMDE